MSNNSRPPLHVVLPVLFLILIAPPAFCQESDSANAAAEERLVAESSYADIFVSTGVDLKSVADRIDVNFARYDPIEKALFLGRGTTDADKLANKVDIIVRKAKKVLDMYPEDFHVVIKIYKTEEDLWAAYEGIFKERKEYKAFYINKFHTIYISEDTISESILAHEIGHSVIDCYFNILPPSKIRELLACYVDVHLKD